MNANNTNNTNTNLDDLALELFGATIDEAPITAEDLELQAVIDMINQRNA